MTWVREDAAMASPDEETPRGVVVEPGETTCGGDPVDRQGCSHPRCGDFRRWCKSAYTVSVWATQITDGMALLKAVTDSLEPTGRTNCACVVMKGRDRGDGLVSVHFTLFFPASFSWRELHARGFEPLRDAVASIDRVHGRFHVDTLACCGESLWQTWAQWADVSRGPARTYVLPLWEGAGPDVDAAMDGVMEEMNRQMRGLGLPMESYPNAGGVEAVRTRLMELLDSK